MRSSSPGFQPDRPGQPGFQVAEAGGFQTQTPAAVGLLEVVLSLDGATARYSARNAATGDLALVLSLDAATRGPRRPVVGGGGRGHRRRVYRAEAAELELVLSLDAYTRFSDWLERDDEEVLLLLIACADPPTWPRSRRSRRF